MIIAYLRHPVDPEEMNRFVSKTLPKAVNAVKVDNWDIRNSLKLIIRDNKNMFNQIDKDYACGLYNALEGLINMKGED
jgi:hypothetical protein